MTGSGIAPALRIVLALVPALARPQPFPHGRLPPPLVAVWLGLDGRALRRTGR